MTKYRPEIDGLRTIAVIPVIIFHLGYNRLSGGYLGVDVFFVISGFLITTILVNKISENNFSMLEFWKRRIRRLFPVLLTVILFFSAFLPTLILKPEIRNLSNDIIPAVLSYFNNYAIFHFGDYWGATAAKSYFLHTWSLSLEEQFYLIYPFFLFFSFKYFRNFITPISIITILSFLIYLYLINNNKIVSFYLLPSRIWELGLGGIVSVINFRNKIQNPTFKNIFVLFGFVLVLTSFLIPQINGNENNYIALLPVFGTAIILGLCSNNDYLGRFLSNKNIVYIGKISYSLYLWHWPIIVLFRSLSFQLNNYNWHLINLIILFITFLFSVFSYHFIENKTRNSPHTLKLVGILILFAFTFSWYYNSENFNVYYKSKYNQVKYYASNYDISPNPIDLNWEKYKMLNYGVYIPKKVSNFKNEFRNSGILKIRNNKNPELILLGDSHGVMWAKLLEEITDSLKISSSFYTSNGTNPLFNFKNINDQEGNSFYSKKERIEYAKSIINNIEKWNPKILMISCRWDGVKDKYREYLIDLLNYLNTKSIKVIILNQPPKLDFMIDNNAAQYLTYLKINPVTGLNSMKITDNLNTIEGNSYLKTLSKSYPNVQIYDVYSNMVLDEKMIVSKDNDLFYYDDDHLSYQGTFFHKSNLVQLIKTQL